MELEAKSKAAEAKLMLQEMAAQQAQLPAASTYQNAAQAAITATATSTVAAADINMEVQQISALHAHCQQEVATAQRPAKESETTAIRQLEQRAERNPENF